MNAGPAEWRLGGAAIAMIGVSYGFARYGYGLFEPQIREVFGLSVGASGAIASGAYLGYALALAAVGMLADRLGPRPLVIAAGVSAALGMALVVLAEQPWQLLAGVTVAGASSGFAWSPYSDAVDQLVAPARRPALLAAIPSGTAFAITAAGGLALSGVGTWRGAWTAFCGIAVLATACNAWLLRGTKPAPRMAGRTSLRFFLRPGTAALYSTALSYGVVGAVYWTFAVAAISGAAEATAGLVFWTLLGIAGITAIGAGRVFARLGLRRSHALLFSALGVATALIAAGPGWWPAIGISAIAYGFAFMATSGLLAVWSYRVFPDRPAVGFTATVLFLGVGAIIGPVLFGALADLWSLRAALLLAAALAMATLGAGPRRTAALIAGDVPGQVARR
ncbi:MFS transporter [Saccharopolyspora sp. NPDC003752]